MSIADYQDTFQIGRVVSRTFGVISRNIATFLPAAAILMLPVIALSFYTGTPNWIAGARLNGWVLGILTFVVQIVCTYLLQAMLVQGTITDLNGERPSLGMALSTGLRVAGPVILISLLALLGMTVGMVLLVVPGIIVAIMWSVTVPVRVVENTGIWETFTRSRALTKGYRWPIFWLVLMYGIVAILLSFLAARFSGLNFGQAGTAHGNVSYIVITWIEQVVLAVVTSTGIASIYYELRRVKEGVAPQQLAAAFD